MPPNTTVALCLSLETVIAMRSGAATLEKKSLAASGSTARPILTRTRPQTSVDGRKRDKNAVTEAFANRPTTLTDYLAIFRRRWWMIIGVPVLTALVAFKFSTSQPPLYQAQAKVLVNRSSGVASGILPQDPTTYDSERFLQTQANIARSPELARRVVVAAQVPRVTPGGLLGSSAVTAEKEADVLNISVSSPNAKDAVLLTNAYAREFAQFKTDLDTSRVRAAVRVLRARARAFEKKGQTTAIAYQTLLQSLGQLETTGALLANNTTVLQPAVGAGQIQPQPRRSLILAGLLGAVLAVGLAFLAEALDRRMRTEEEIEELVAVPLLGRVSRPRTALRKKNALVMVEKPTSAPAETFRKLRGTIDFVNFQHGGDLRTLMFTSAVQREGKSTTVANVAVALARAGRRVALVDLDLRRPFLHTFFGVDAQPGATDVVVGRQQLNRALRHVSLPSSGRSTIGPEANGGPPANVSASNGRSGLDPVLHFLPSGTIPPQAGEFLAGEGVAAVLAELREQFDVVLVDAPPLTVVGDAMTLSASVDAIVAVIHLGVQRRLLSELARELRNCRAPAIGFILTGVRRGDQYGYGYGYDNGANLHTQPKVVSSERSA